jgi:ferredoxin/flavodoxin---NADP+ reductase
LSRHEYLGDSVRAKLFYYPISVTREPFRNRGRVTDLLESEQVFLDMNLPPLDQTCDRIMVRGSPEMVKDVRTLLDNAGFIEGRHSTPGHHVVERAFVERQLQRASGANPSVESEWRQGVGYHDSRLR